MTWRRWTVLLAIFGLLVHAGALVRHITIAGAPTSTVVDFAPFDGDTLLCDHDGSSVSGVPASDLQAPNHHKHAPCPICTGGAATAAVLPGALTLPVIVRAAATATRRLAIAWLGVRRQDWPQSRAPPALDIA